MLLTVTLVYGAIDVDGTSDEFVRVGRVQSTHFPSRHNSLASSSSAESTVSTKNPTSPNQVQPTSATKVTSFTNGAATKPSESTRSSSNSVASSGATVYNIQEQLQPPSSKAPQYIYLMPSQPHATTGTTQMMVPEGKTLLTFI